MLEKLSGPRLHKLLIINLIESDLQIVCLKSRREILRENYRVLEYKYWARRGYTIEDPLLEKIIFFNNSIINGKKNAWLIID